MRAYFDKLLTPNPQQKQLPLIYPLLIALFSGAVFSFALAPYHYWWLAILSPALLYATLRRRSAKQAFAFNSMGLRQYGFNYDAFLNNVNFLKSIPAAQKPEYEKIGQQAYQADIVSGTTYAQKESVRRDFANQIYQDCISPKRS